MKLFVTLSTNSLARRPDIVATILGVSSSAVRHNGGKVCVVLVSDTDMSRFVETCDAAHQVTAYEVAS